MNLIARLLTSLILTIALLAGFGKISPTSQVEALADLDVSVNGRIVTFSWGPVPWPQGQTYDLAVLRAPGCDPGHLQILGFPRAFTNNTGGTYSWDGLPDDYVAVLYAWPAPNPIVILSNCVSFTIAGPAISSPCNSFFECLFHVAGPAGDPAGGFIPASSFIGQLVTKILPVVLSLAGFLTIIVILISAIQFITSSGNPELAAAARGRLTFALIGFALIILAFAITQIVDRLFLRSGAV